MKRSIFWVAVDCGALALLMNWAQAPIKVVVIAVVWHLFGYFQGLARHEVTS